MKKKVREMIELIEADGWRFYKQRGSHQQYKHSTKPGKVTIPNHGINRELDHKLVESILKQAGLR
ncbi:MAG: type II toxin-antitoxin system HicA family toxin [Prevotellaceae bacterium]|jgi:predicted RNA binding protein YcfA (HicA-like mRNA interferase family)|nr:type II toxin-antitoxin system HicA family toxin [Prevotellaceae bacterium]